MKQQATGTAGATRLRPEVVDRVEQVLFAALFAFLAWRVSTSLNPFAPLLIVSESMIMFFLVIRRPTEKVSIELGDWLVAVTGTCAPLLIVPIDTRIDALVPVGVVLFGLGLVIQVMAKVSLNRSIGVGPANRGIKQDGVYRFVRHPMYAGYIMNNIGILMLMFSLTNTVIYLIAWTAQIMRILAEERLLSQDPAYRDFMQHTRWRLVPGIW
ncbi:MAG: isoprenylcysteine carboxylmethyltransferase family protein [Sphingomonadales bacterium]|nr:isoprenylcysteine carboxylmethyltransferase family protein [Sphingomonadales bacterium]MDE2569793.1 isoprenylcysteine carboxylmethyltransferase family protein [Sphingomonadales bacterium]